MKLSVLNYPNLNTDNHIETSEQANYYNCIAHAAGCNEKWWWPGESIYTYWPKNVPNRDTVYAFLTLFRNLGYEKCADGSLEEGFLKVAIYADQNKKVKHAARQLENGHWTSKMGKNIDIEHFTVEAIEGPNYGHVVNYLKRSINADA